MYCSKKIGYLLLVKVATLVSGELGGEVLK